MPEVTLTTHVAKKFACAGCGTHGRVEFDATGTASVTETRAVHGHGVVADTDTVQAEVADDAAGTFALVRCPQCGKRAPGAVGAIIGRVAALVALAPVVAFVIVIWLDQRLYAVVGAGLCLGAAAWYARRDYQRLVRARSIVVGKLKPGPSAKPGSRGHAR